MGLSSDIMRYHRDACRFWCAEDRDAIVIGIVYQLPARAGRPVFVSGHNDPYGVAGPARIDFSTIFYGSRDSAENDRAKMDAATAATDLAWRYAKAEVKRATAFRAGTEYSIVADQLTGLATDLFYARIVRRAASLWSVSAKGHNRIRINRNPGPGGATLRPESAVDEILDQIREKRSLLAALKDGVFGLENWDPRDESQMQAFREGAGLSV